MSYRRKAPLAVTLTHRQAWPILAMLATTGEDPRAWATRVLVATALGTISLVRQHMAYLAGVRRRGSGPKPTRRIPTMVPVPIWPKDAAPAVRTVGASVTWDPRFDGTLRVSLSQATSDLVEQAADMVGAQRSEWVRLVLVAAAEPTWLPRVI